MHILILVHKILGWWHILIHLLHLLILIILIIMKQYILLFKLLNFLLNNKLFFFLFLFIHIFNLLLIHLNEVLRILKIINIWINIIS